MSDYSELKRLAEASRVANHDERGPDEAFQEALHPEVVLALIAENERLANNRDMWRGQCDRQSEMLRLAHEMETQLKAEVAGLKTGYQAYEQVNAELKAEVEALRKERDSRHPFRFAQESPAIGFTGCVICGVYTDHGGLPCPKTRATADTAMAQGEQS